MNKTDLTKQELAFLIQYLKVDSVEQSEIFIKKYPFKIHNKFANAILKKVILWRAP